MTADDGSEPRIRDYEPSDRAACRRLWRDLVERHRGLYRDPTIGGDEPERELDEHLDHPRLAGLWIAERDGEVVGLCGLLLEGDEAELEPIVVAPAHRGAGVGARLAHVVIEEARRRGVRFLNVRPVGRNAEAIRFFHREGFRLLGRLELSMPMAAELSESPHPEIPIHGRGFRS